MTLPGRIAAAVCAATLTVAAAIPAGAQQIDLQLQEIRGLIREKRYPLALESLRLVARQIQDLRLEALAPAFPAAPTGWTALAPISLAEEDEIWTDRVHAQRAYVAASGAARMDVTIDVNTPLGPTAALGFNALAVNADPLSRVVDVGGEKGLLRFNADTGEGELRILPGRDVLVSARGRGLASPAALVDLARGVDFALLRRTGR
jgi:hypothetical protein